MPTLTFKHKIIGGFILLVTLSVLFARMTVTSVDYITRAEADERLGRACMAATKLYLDRNGSTITEFIGVNYSGDDFLKEGYRVATLSMVESNEKYDKEKQFKCTYEEALPWYGYVHLVEPFRFTMDKTEIMVKDLGQTDSYPHLSAMYQAAQDVLTEKPEKPPKKIWAEYIMDMVTGYTR